MSIRRVRIRQAPKSGGIVRQPFDIERHGLYGDVWAGPPQGKGFVITRGVPRSSSYNTPTAPTNDETFPAAVPEVYHGVWQALSAPGLSHQPSNGTSDNSGRIAAYAVESLPCSPRGRDFFCTITPVIF